MKQTIRLVLQRFTVALLPVAVASSVSGCGWLSPAKEQGAEAPGIDEVTYINYIWDESAPAEGEGLAMIQDRFRIRIKSQFVPQTDYMSRLSVLMASGSMPDVVGVKDLDSNFFNWAKQGAFLPLNDYYDRYPSLQLVPAHIRDQFTVSGNIYAIPRYYPEQYLFVIMLRQDWLTRLNLKVPTSYEELKQVAIAFTRDDPDGNGKNDTYGLALSQSINPAYHAGAYWDPEAWYHQNAEGEYIPGIIGPGRKDVIQMMADLYKEGAVTKDFAVMNWNQGNQEFYSGRAGIFIGSPRGMSELFMEGMLKLNPNAKLVTIEPFAAPDGSQGYASQLGFLGFTALSSKLLGHPDKINKIMDVIDYGRNFVPPSERTPDNPDYDWRLGGLNKGYSYENKVVHQTKMREGKIPALYLFDSMMWAPSDEANIYSSNYQIPLLRQVTGEMEKMFVKFKDKTYMNPHSRIDSETYMAKWTELTQFLIVEQTKMITGQRPISDWDRMVKEWSDRGGANIVTEMNRGIEVRRSKGTGTGNR